MHFLMVTVNAKRKGKERKGRKGRERKGWKGRERKGKERKGLRNERKGKD